MNTPTPAGSTRRLSPLAWVALAAALILALGLGWWHGRGPATPPPRPPPPANPNPPAEPATPPAAHSPGTPDAATTAVMEQWRTALNADDWQRANALEDEILARGDAALPNLEAEFSPAPEIADLPATVTRLDRLAAVLGRINTPAAVAALNRLLPRADQPEVRGQLLLALAKTGERFHTEVSPALLKAIENGKEAETTRQSAAVLLVRRGDPAALRQLIAWAQVPPAADPAIGNLAIAALAYARQPDGQPTPTAWETLQNILTTDAAAPRRAAAAAALGASQQPAAVQPLAGALQDSAVAVRRAAVAGLEQTPPATARDEALRTVAQTETDAGVRALAVKALGRPGAAENLPVLTALLLPAAATAPAPPAVPIYVQLKAVEAMEGIGGAPAQESLTKVLEKTPAVAVRSAAQAALNRLKKATGPELTPAQPEPGF